MGSSVDSLRSARLFGRFVASFVNEEIIVQGEEGQGEAILNREGANKGRLIYPSGYGEMGGMFNIEPPANSRVSLPIGEMGRWGSGSQHNGREHSKPARVAPAPRA